VTSRIASSDVGGGRNLSGYRHVSDHVMRGDLSLIRPHTV